MQRSGLVFVLIVLAFTVHSGHSIMCYQCNSEVDKDCLNPKQIVPTVCSRTTSKSSFNKTYHEEDNTALDLLEEAENADLDAHFGCVKFEMRSGHQKVILRSCEVRQFLKICEFIGILQDVTEGLSCSACMTDGCNGSSIPIASIFYTFLMTIGVFALASPHSIL